MLQHGIKRAQIHLSKQRKEIKEIFQEINMSMSRYSNTRVGGPTTPAEGIGGALRYDFGLSYDEAEDAEDILNNVRNDPRSVRKALEKVNRKYGIGKGVKELRIDFSDIPPEERDEIDMGRQWGDIGYMYIDVGNDLKETVGFYPPSEAYEFWSVLYAQRDWDEYLENF